MYGGQLVWAVVAERRWMVVDRCGYRDKSYSRGVCVCGGGGGGGHVYRCKQQRSQPKPCGLCRGKACL